MLYRVDQRRLEVRSVDGSYSRTVDLGGFPFVSSLRLDPAGKRLALTAVPAGARLPNLKDNYRGDLRLFVVDLESGSPTPLGKGYAHDAVWFPEGDRIAYHDGKGVATISVGTGAAGPSFKAGMFNWGPPSVSVSPSGSAVAFVKWKGDHRHLAVLDLVTGQGKVMKPSCFQYAWASATELAYSLSGGIKLLDVASEKSATLLKNVSALARLPGWKDALPQAAALVGKPLVVDEVGDPFVWGGRLYFVLLVADADRRVHAIGSVRLDRTDLQSHYVTTEASIRGFQLINSGRTLAVHLEFYKDLRVVDRRVVYAGADASRIPADHFPLPRIQQPEFGFHYVGNPDAGE
jgi:hypothetical protein